jgi:hypothetical protein
MEEENKFSTSSVSGGILLIVIFLVLLVMAFYDSSLQQKKTHPPSNASTSNPFKEPLIPINPSDLKAPTDRQTPEKYQGSNDSTKTALSSEPTLDVALEKNPPISSHRQLEQFIGNLPPASTSQNSQQNLKPISQENSSQKKDPPESSKNTPPVPPQQVRGGKDERFQPLEKKKEIILPELLQAQAVSEELAQKSYAMDLDEVHLERDSQEKVGEVEGRSYTKAQYKAFLKEFLGQSYIDTYLFYLRCRRALRDLQVELDPQKVQETAGESLKKFIQNPTNQKMYQDLGLSQKTFESWYRRQAFLEESLQKLFEKREVSEKTVREKFESQFGEKGIHYDIKQIMLVRYNKQSKFYPESQYQEELQNGKVEESLQKWGTQLLAELQQNPAQWNDFLRKKSDEAQKLRTQGRLQFTPEAFGEAVYQAVLQLQPGQFYGPVKNQ